MGTENWNVCPVRKSAFVFFPRRPQLCYSDVFMEQIM